MTDVIQSERKILLSLGEKNFQGRVVYYNSEAEQALEKWLENRTLDSEYLFYGYVGGELSYVGAWMIMRKALKKSGHEHKEYSLHSLRHTFCTNLLNQNVEISWS